MNLVSLDLKKLADMQRWWLLRCIYTKRPLQEKMTLFWHGLLTSATSKVGLPNPTPQNPDPPHVPTPASTDSCATRPGPFPDLLLGIAQDPAMMIWLDSQTNVKGKPNENFARELMELFSLGITGPTASPTTPSRTCGSSARLHRLGLQQGHFVFNANQHDTGLKTVLGKTANLDGKDVVKLVAASRPPHHLSRNCWEFFAYPTR